MASDLISRKALLQKFAKSTWHDGRTFNEEGYFVRAYDVHNMIDKAPAVDAVEVVRCKDCVHAGAFPNAYAKRRFEGGMNCYLCRGDDSFGMANVSLVYPDDYCSDGLRKEKEDAVD